jgi:hypothetical protein
MIITEVRVGKQDYNHSTKASNLKASSSQLFAGQTELYCAIKRQPACIMWAFGLYCGAVRAFELATVGRVQLQLCVR